MDISSVSNNQVDIQSLLINSTSKTNNTTSNNNLTNNTACYAKKGEPMYMSDMDTDDDGVVTLDEFRDYCKSKNISTQDMIKMSKSAASFRVMSAEENTINYISKLVPNISPKVKQSESKSWNVKQSENQYNISNDSKTENKVSYSQYMEYCQHNAVSNDSKSNTKVKNSSDGKLTISNFGKAAKSYNNIGKNFVKSTFEKAV